jgi:hypothetical protein
MASSAARRHPLPDLVETILAAEAITDDHVRLLRREVFADGVVERAEAELVFDLNDKCRFKDASWREFFVDALTDTFVWRTEPKGYVGEEDGRFLMERLSADGRIDSLTELELLVNIVHWANGCPEELVLLGMNAVKDTALNGGGVLFGPNRRRAGVIDRADVALLRRLLFGSGGDGSLTVTRREADLLFDLHDATRGRQNVETWPCLFVRAVGSHLMFPRGEPAIPTAEEALRRQRWLGERRGVGRIIAGMASTIVSGRFGDAFVAADLFGSRRRQEEQAKAAGEAAEAERRAAVDAAEATWLCSRITADGYIDTTERALLAFIKENAARTDPSLDRLFVRAGM